MLNPEIELLSRIRSLQLVILVLQIYQVLGNDKNGTCAVGGTKIFVPYFGSKFGTRGFSVVLIPMTSVLRYQACHV